MDIDSGRLATGGAHEVPAEGCAAKPDAFDFEHGTGWVNPTWKIVAAVAPVRSLFEYIERRLVLSDGCKCEGKEQTHCY